jgi:hypothetical protein
VLAVFSARTILNTKALRHKGFTKKKFLRYL